MISSEFQSKGSAITQIKLIQFETIELLASVAMLRGYGVKGIQKIEPLLEEIPPLIILGKIV